MGEYQDRETKEAAEPTAAGGDREIRGPIRTKTFLDNGAGDPVVNGEAGFSRRMIANTSAFAAANHDFEALRMHELTPATHGADEQIALRVFEQAKIESKKEDASSHTSRHALYATNEALLTARAFRRDLTLDRSRSLAA